MGNEPRLRQAAVDLYLRLTAAGEPHETALRGAILLWLRHCDRADGREARLCVVQALLAARAMAPRDYEDWVILASGEALWEEDAPAAIHRLSIDCRAIEIAAAAGRIEDYEAVGADVLRDYLRAELPGKVSRLRRLAFELLARERGVAAAAAHAPST
jgi:hypothetical protein